MPKSTPLARLAGCIVLAGILLAGMMYPVVGGIGLISNKAADTIENVSSQLINGRVPEVTTMTDVTGKPFAYIYDQRRTQVGYDDISDNMIRAIVSIEDKRFFEHDGVDWRGTVRAFLKNSSSGEVQQGASTLDQQYIKNYQLLVLARTDADRQAATETTPARKLREVRMALTLEQTLTDAAKRSGNLDDAKAKLAAKKEIVTRYLNLVPFGNGAFGIEQAAQTYFGIPAKRLSAPQAAMLAGMVQSSSSLNPYSNTKGVTDRRNLVLQTMKENFPKQGAEYEAAKQSPLGVLKRPKSISGGCIAADDNGYFCDYALQFLAQNGLSRDNVARGGYTIRTTLDPRVQRSTIDALRQTAGAQTPGIADVMSVIAPGQDKHSVVAMGSSRVYGLNQRRNETVQPQPFSMVGDGAGSVFKLFTTAAAMEKGLGIGSNLQVPNFYAAQGMGFSSDVPGCPANTYCVKNDGSFAPVMSVPQALATSPNTAFVKLIQETGVTPTVDMAVRLGMRSYAQPGTAGSGDTSLADYIKKGNFGSFTLGPNAVNALELSNVAATLASSGKWCPPNPIAEITEPKRDRFGNQVMDGDNPARQAVAFNPPPCEQVVEPGLADTLANAMSGDDRGGGTSAGSAAATGWNLPLAGKTGTTEAHRSSAFLGFTNNLAAATYIYGDGDNPTGICSFPLRQCYDGDLYGGKEPALTWYRAMKPVAGLFGPTRLPQVDPKYVRGSNAGEIPKVVGKTASEATMILQRAGFKVAEVPTDSDKDQGNVVFTAPSDTAMPGSTVTIYVSTGNKQTSAPPPRPGQTTITLPGVGTVVVPAPSGGGG